MKSKSTSLAVIFFSICSANAVTITDGVNMGTTNTVPASSNSIATGTSNTVASNSIAVGTSNNASLNSIAVGFFNISKNYSLALGDGSSADWGSISAGVYTTIDSNSSASIAVGEVNEIYGSSASALLGGGNVVKNQWGSAAIGNSNTMMLMSGKTGSGNVLLGQLNRIDQSFSGAPTDIQGTVLVGVDNETSSSMAFAFGKGNIAQTDTVTIGTYAQTVSNASLIVGKGISTARSNGLVVLRNGEVQIAGSLVVGGSPVLVSGNSSLGTALNGLTVAPSSSTWKAAFVARGDVAPLAGQTVGGLMAVGTSSKASGPASIAVGASSLASQQGAIAIGANSVASSLGSLALGDSTWSVGAFSTAIQLSSATATIHLPQPLGRPSAIIPWG